jgi:RND family efflux transporter MFP subunit
MPPATVTVAPVETRELVEWEEFTGRVEAQEIVELRPRVSGYITEVHFQAGALVRKDDILFTIDRRPFQTRLESANAELKRVEATAKAAQQEFRRVSALLAAKAIAPEQAEAREAAHQQAQASVASAQAAQHSAELELSHTEVRAPISGRISRALATTGNYVSGMAGSATLLTTIVTVDPVYVYADIDENSLLKLQALQRGNKLYTNGEGRVPVELQLSNETGFPHRGFVESFDNRLDPGTGSMVLRAQFPNVDGALTPGLFARVRIPMTARYPALLVDEKAILTDQANKYVLVLSDKSLADYRKVLIGPSIDGKRIIREGLAAGEKIIVNGQARLPMPGMPVQPVEAPAAESKTAAK